LIGITGATGFIGRRLVERLVRRGYPVRVLVRPASLERLPRVPLDKVLGTLEDGEAVARFARGCGAVVHCAGLVKALSRDAFFRVNVEGTRRLLESLAPETRLVHLSSLAAREPTLSPYAASKRAGEEAVLSWRGSKLVLRPPAVYGPGDRALRPLLEALRYGVLFQIGPREARFSLLHVDDLVAAIEGAIERPEVEGRFDLSDGEVYSWRRVAEIGERFFRRPVRTVPIPRPLLLGVAGISLALGRLLGRPPMLTPAKVRELRHTDWVCQNNSVWSMLDRKPQVGLFEGLATLFARRSWPTIRTSSNR